MEAANSDMFIFQFDSITCRPHNRARNLTHFIVISFMPALRADVELDTVNAPTPQDQDSHATS